MFQLHNIAYKEVASATILQHIFYSIYHEPNILFRLAFHFHFHFHFHILHYLLLSTLSTAFRLVIMQLFSILALLLLQNSLFACAAQRGSEPEDNKPPDDPVNVGGDVGSAGAGNQNPAKANVPGAIAVGQNSQPAAKEDNEADIEEIGEKLKDLIEKLEDVIKDIADSDSGTTTTNAVVTSVKPLPASAYPCSWALGAYSTCSSVNANFSALPKTQQAGCLCNANSGFDFNGNMKDCYNFAQNRTQYQAYATAVASGTALCACDPNAVIPTDVYGDGNSNPCKATTTAAAAATTTPAPTPAPAAASPTATGTASRGYGIRIAATLLGAMIPIALL